MKTGPRLTVSNPSYVFNVWDYRMLLGFKFTCKKLVLILSTLKCSHGKMNKLQPPVFTWMNFTSVKQQKKKINLPKNTYRRMLSIHTLNMQKKTLYLGEYMPMY